MNGNEQELNVEQIITLVMKEIEEGGMRGEGEVGEAIWGVMRRGERELEELEHWEKGCALMLEREWEKFNVDGMNDDDEGRKKRGR